MKKITKCLFLSFISLSLLVSCQNEPLDIIDDIDISAETYSFVYKGVNYESNFYLKEDSTIYLINNEARSVFEELGKNPNVATLIDENYKINYFDNREELINEINSKQKPELRYNVYKVKSFNIDLYEKDNYKGWALNYTGPIEQGKMHSSRDNKLSSLRMTTTSYVTYDPNSNPNMWEYLIFHCFEYPYYEGWDIFFYCWAAAPSNSTFTYEVPKLKNIYLVNGNNWNDRISSYKIYTSYDFPQLQQ